MLVKQSQGILIKPGNTLPQHNVNSVQESLDILCDSGEQLKIEVTTRIPFDDKF